MMKRINPSDLVAFFRANPNIKPVQGFFADYEEPEDDLLKPRLRGCCGLTATYLRTGRPGLNLRDLADLALHDGVGEIVGWLELEPKYALGFAKGWDNYHYNMTPEQEMSFQDGRAAWLACRELEESS